MANKMNKSRVTGDKREIYLLKVYRRASQGSPFLYGTVEEITGRKKGVFKTGEELLRWLNDQAEQGAVPY